MSPNPVAAAATWTVALVIDAVAVVVAGALLLWDRHCPTGFVGCPASADVLRRDELVLVGLALVVLAVALYALVRGRLLLLGVQLALGVLLAYGAYSLVPAPFDQLRRDVHLAAAAPAHYLQFAASGE